MERGPQKEEMHFGVSPGKSLERLRRIIPQFLRLERRILSVTCLCYSNCYAIVDYYGKLTLFDMYISHFRRAFLVVN